MAERIQERCKTAAAQQAAAEAAVTPDTSLPPRPPLPPASTAKIVVWQAILPSSGPACHLHEALRQLCPERFPSTTSAKRAVRRSEVLLDGGRVIDPSRTLVGGEMLQVVAREGASQMRWYPQHALKGEQSSAVMDAASKYSVAAAIPPALRLRVLFEDDHMACLVKPPGIPTDSPSGRSGGTTSSLPAAGTPGDSESDGEPHSSSGGRGMQLHAPGAYQQMTHLLTPSTAVGALRRPRHVHRLDEPTGGLLLAAKTRLAQQELCAAFEQRRVTKRYTALVWGRLEGQGFVRYSLNGRACETEYKAVRHTRVDMAALGLNRPNPSGDAEDAAAAPCASSSTGAARGAAGATSRSHCVQDVAAALADTSESGEAALADSSESGEAAAVWVTTVDLFPHTGRKHQLRRHMALLLHPILGDPKHGFGYRAQRHQSGQSLAAGSHCVLQEAAVEAGAAAAAPRTEVHAPDRPLQAPALLQAAAAVATQRLQLKLCLWAVELRLEQHPVSSEPLPVFSLPEPAAFAATRDLLGNTCWVSAGATT